MRTLILDPGWNALLFWRDEQSQSVVDDAVLPLSDSLRAQLAAFASLHSELYFGDDDKPSELDVRLLDDKGLLVWQELRRELGPDYRVLFLSHQFMEPFERLEDFEAVRKWGS